jgi:chromosome partitioning protein
MRKIAFAIEKGGTAKTTSAVHVAHALAAQGGNVLLVDTDTQDQCAAHLGVEQGRPGLAELILGETVPRQCILKARDNLYLLPSGSKLAAVKAGVTDVAKAAAIGPDEIVGRALSFTESGRLDVVILDTAPGSDPFLISVLKYSDLIVVPVPPEMMAVRGLARFSGTLKAMGRKVDYILPTVHDRRVAKTGRILNKLEERFGDRLLGKISYTTRISEAAGAGMTVFEYSPGHRSAGEYAEAAKILGNGA